jgi:hypothetical protein
MNEAATFVIAVLKGDVNKFEQKMNSIKRKKQEKKSISFKILNKILH